MYAGLGVDEHTLSDESLGVVAGHYSLGEDLRNSEAAQKSKASEFSSGSDCSSNEETW